jgi:uncharacterized phage-associated protein
MRMPAAKSRPVFSSEGAPHRAADHGVQPMCVMNVAETILSETGPLSPEKLERLVYFAQVAVTAEGQGALFHEPIEAWEHGPVCPALYNRLCGRLIVRPGDLGGVREGLAPSHAQIVSAMLERLGRSSILELNALACGEAPWLQARRNAFSQVGSLRISEKAIAEDHGNAFCFILGLCR